MKLKTLVGACVLVGMAAGAAQAYTPYLQYPERKLKYPKRTTGWDEPLQVHYEAWKSRFLVGGLVKGTDPSMNARYISEGQSYGLLLSLWFNDQATFNTIWDATESGFWRSGKGTGGWYAWLNTGDDNFAGDADQDIAGALIFASALVDSGYWTDYKSGGYKTKAKVVVQSVWNNLVNKSDYQIESWPGAGSGIRNSSYHMPQWYPVFKEFAAKNSLTGMDWDKVKTAAFGLINAQPSSSKGMARNFSNSSGGSPGGGTSSPNNYDMGFDAIRVPYRMGMSAMWYKDPSAVTWCKNVWNAGFVSAAKPGMYSVGGPSLWGWGTASDGSDSKYEKPMTTTMWAVSALGVADSLPVAAEAFSTMASYMGGTAGLNSRNYFGEYVVTDSTVNASAGVYPPNKNYFAQTLGMLGAVAMAGRAPNVWDDMKNGWVVPDTSATLKTFSANKTKGIYYVDSVKFSVAFSKAATCTLTVQGQSSKAKYTSVFKTTGTTTTVVPWKMGVKGGLTLFNSDPGEFVTATLRWSGMTGTSAVTNVISNIQMCGTATSCPTVGIEGNTSALKGSLQRQADGSVLVRQPWFSGSVRIRLRNVAGMALYQSEAALENGAVRVPSLSLAPGWYAIETESNGQRATQSFTLSR